MHDVMYKSQFMQQIAFPVNILQLWSPGDIKDVHVSQIYRRYYTGEAQWVYLHGRWLTQLRKSCNGPTRCRISAVSNCLAPTTIRSCAAWRDLYARFCISIAWAIICCKGGGPSYWMWWSISDFDVCEARWWLVDKLWTDEEVPPSAVIGGYWRDETPRCIINAELVGWKPG